MPSRSRRSKDRDSSHLLPANLDDPRFVERPIPWWESLDETVGELVGKVVEAVGWLLRRGPY